MEEVHQEDNDLIFLGKHKKATRQLREEGFVEKWLPMLEEKCDKVEILPNKYILLINLKVYDYFPKVDRLLDRSKNEWTAIGEGLNKIKNLLNIK